MSEYHELLHIDEYINSRRKHKTIMESVKKKRNRKLKYPPTERDWRRKELKTKWNRSRVMIGNQFHRWKSLKEDIGVKKNEKMAKVMMDCYTDFQKKAAMSGTLDNQQIAIKPCTCMSENSVSAPIQAKKWRLETMETSSVESDSSERTLTDVESVADSDQNGNGVARLADNLTTQNEDDDDDAYNMSTDNDDDDDNLLTQNEDDNNCGKSLEEEPFSLIGKTERSSADVEHCSSAKKLRIMAEKHTLQWSQGSRSDFTQMAPQKVPIIHCIRGLPLNVPFVLDFTSPSCHFQCTSKPYVLTEYSSVHQNIPVNPVHISLKENIVEVSYSANTDNEDLTVTNSKKTIVSPEPDKKKGSSSENSKPVLEHSVIVSKEDTATGISILTTESDRMQQMPSENDLEIPKVESVSDEGHAETGGSVNEEINVFSKYYSDRNRIRTVDKESQELIVTRIKTEPTDEGEFVQYAPASCNQGIGDHQLNLTQIIKTENNG